MPRIPTLDDLGARPVPRSQRSIATVRNAGAVAEAVGDLGNTIRGIGDRMLDGAEARESAEGRSAWLIAKTKIDEQFAHDQDFGTKEKRYSEALSNARQTISGNFTFNRARQAFDQDSNVDYERGLSAMRENIFAGNADRAVADHNALSNRNMEAALTSRDFNDSVALLTSVQTSARGLREQGYISAQQEQEQDAALKKTFGTKWMQLRPPEEQVKLLEPYHGKDAPIGTVAGMIPVDVRGKLLDQAKADARVEQTRLQVEQRRQQAEKEQADKEHEDTTAALIDQGVVVAGAEIQTAIATAEARGDTSKAVGLKAKAYANTVVAGLQDATVPQINEELFRIEAKKDWRSDPNAVMAHNALEKLRGNVQSKPATLPPVDYSNPQSIERRRSAVRRDQQARGLSQPDFWGAEAEDIRDQYHNGPAGRMAASDKAAAFGGMDAITAARQIAPNDAVFAYSAGLPAPSRRLALEGRDVMAANPKVAKTARASTTFQTKTGVAFSHLPPGFASDARATALSIASAQLARDGVTEPTDQQFDEYFGKALNLALGAQYNNGVRTGGLGDWKDNPVILPQGMTQQDFEARISNMSGTFRAYDDRGNQITAGQIKARFKPVSIGGGRYHFIDEAGGAAMAANGTPAQWNIWTFDPAPQREVRRVKGNQFKSVNDYWLAAQKGKGK